MITAPPKPKKYPSERYNPHLTIRVPKPVRLGLSELAKRTHTTLTGVVLQHLPPFELYATTEGQDALRRFEVAIARSTAIYKAPPRGVLERSSAPTEEFFGLVLRNLGTEEAPMYVHTVKQREGQSREEAVSAYAFELWKEWCLLPAEEREEFVKGLESEHHVFVISYVRFRYWNSFRSAYEADLHRRSFLHEGEPTTPAELRFSAWLVDYLEAKWKDVVSQQKPKITEDGVRVMILREGEDALRQARLEHGSAGGSQLITLQEADTEDALPLEHELRYYEHVSEHENVLAWARYLLKHAQELFEEADFETLRSNAESEGYRVRRLALDNGEHVELLKGAKE